MLTLELNKFEDIDIKNTNDIVYFICKSTEKNLNYPVQTLSISRLNNQYRLEILAFEKTMPSPILREIPKHMRFYISLQSNHLREETVLNKVILQAFAAIKSISTGDNTFVGDDCDYFYNLSDEEIIKDLLQYIGFNPLKDQYK